MFLLGEFYAVQKGMRSGSQDLSFLSIAIFLRIYLKFFEANQLSIASELFSEQLASKFTVFIKEILYNYRQMINFLWDIKSCEISYDKYFISSFARKRKMRKFHILILQSLLMILERTPEEYDSWKKQMYGYEKNKRTKKPFGKEFVPDTERVSNFQVQEKQRQFNPVLQKFQDPVKQANHQSKLQKNRNQSLVMHLNSSGRNYRPYDIITLHGELPENQSLKTFNKKDKETVRNIYNPINNKPIPQFYLSNKRVKPTPQKNFKYQGPKIREFDIVKCQYRQNNEQKMEKDILQENCNIFEKYDKTHAGYNPVVGKFYNQQKQQQYEHKLVNSQILQSSGALYNKRFPPTYLEREPLILDRSKPPTDSLIALQRKRSNAKQRFKLKYIIQEEYERRNKEDFQRKEQLIRNRVHNSHAFENMAKQFSSLIGNNYDSNKLRYSEADKPNLHSSVNYSARSMSSRQGTPMSIKSGGFT